MSGLFNVSQRVVMSRIKTSASDKTCRLGVFNAERRLGFPAPARRTRAYDVQFRVCAKLLVFRHAQRLEGTRAISGSGQTEFFPLAATRLANSPPFVSLTPLLSPPSFSISLAPCLSSVSSAYCDRDTRRCSLFGTTLTESSSGPADGHETMTPLQ